MALLLVRPLVSQLTQQALPVQQNMVGLYPEARASVHPLA